MNLAYSIKMLADMCYLMFLVSSLASCAEHSGLLITTPLILAVSAYLSRMCAVKMPKKRIMRFVPLLLIAACFIFTNTIADKIVTGLLSAYLIWAVARKDFTIGYDQSVSRFYLCLKLLPLPIILVVIASNYTGMRDVMLPYFLFFFILSAMLLRMLRHNDRVITDMKFRLVTLTEMGLLCGVSWLMSSGYMLAALKWVFNNVIVRIILRPILMGLVYVFAGISWLLNKIFSGIDFNVDEMDILSKLDMSKDEQAQGMLGEMGKETQESASGEIIAYVLIGLAIVIAVVVVILILRAFLKNTRREENNSFDDERSSLDSPEDKAPRLGRTPRDRVRLLYRKFIKYIDGRFCEIDEYYDTRDIARAARARLSRDGVDELREVYVKARYSTDEMTDADVARAKKAFDTIKRNEKER